MTTQPSTPAEPTGRRRAAAWAAGVALVVAAGVALAYAVALRVAGVPVLLLGARWDEGLGTDVVISLLVAGGAVAAGVVLARRTRPEETLPWRWLLGGAVLVIPLGALLELVAALLRSLLGVPA